MNLVEYHKSIGRELLDVKNRFRDLIGDQYHRLADGKHKESILKTILQRHLPKNISAKNGFIRFDDISISSEIDILLFSNDRPLLFENSDLVISTPHAVFGGIEVKTTLTSSNLTESLEKVAINLQNTSEHLDKAYWSDLHTTVQSMSKGISRSYPWFSLFAFESNVSDEIVLNRLNEVAKGDYRRAIPCVCLGPNKFVRFWSEHRKSITDTNPFTGWRVYDLKGLAFSYYISNMIWQDHVNSTETNPWFALESKEIEMVQELPFSK